MHRKHLVALILATLATAPADLGAQQTIYKWTDKDGKVHFSDTPPPPKEVTGVSQKRMGGGYVDQSNLPFATQVAMKKNPVTLYSGTDCGEPCAQARSLLSKRGIPYSERDAQNNASDGEALKKLIGSLDVPTLVVGENKLKGFEDGAWQGALDGAGYPRTSLPGQIPPRAPPAPKAPEPPPAEPAPEAPPAEAK